MKKKIACLVLLMFCVITVLTGCNLFVTDYDLYINQVVAQTNILLASGEEKTITVTKEELVNGYYNYGQTLTNQYGYTYEDALDYVLEILLQRKVLLNHVQEKATLEGELGAKTAYKYQLNRNEYNEVIEECWDFIDSQLKEVEEEIKEKYDFADDVFPEEEEKESEFQAYTPYVKTLNYNGEKVTAKKKTYVNEIIGDEPDADSLILWDAEKKVLGDYKKPVYSNSTIERLVWSKYYTNLKENEKNKKSIEDRSDEATFARELERVYKINLENKYLSKYQETYESNVGFDSNGELTDEIKQKIIDRYTTTYNENKEVYNISKTAFYGKVTSTTDRENYVYYGEDEALITCLHILVKLDQTQIDKIKEIEEDAQLTDVERETKANEYRDVASTYATKRDSEGFEIEGEKISVLDLYNEIATKIATETATYSKGSQIYAETAIRIFNEYMYMYNQDTGIQNATFDYVVGTKTSPMVESFTKATRDLYNEDMIDATNGVGYAGAMSSYILEENDNYSGFHIVMYTGTLKNEVNPQTLTVDNVVEKLGSIKTSESKNQTLFEYYYDEIIETEKDYDSYEQNLVSSLLGGREIKYFRYLYSDLLA